MTQLPKGWISATIADVTQDILNVHPERDPTKEFGYVDISSINNSNYTIEDVRKILGANAPSRARRPVQAEDVLFSNVRTYLRNIAMVPKDSEAQICSTGFTVLRSNGVVDPLYLFRWVLTDAFIEGVTPRQTGTHYPATSDRVVRSEVILLPPINEQRRIVVKLEKLLNRVDSAQRRLATIPNILKRFRQSVLAAACSGRLTSDWREANPLVQSMSAEIELLRKATTEAKLRRRVPEHVAVPDSVAAWDLPNTWETYSAAELLRVGAFIDVKDGNHGANHPKVSEFTEKGLPFITAAQVNNYQVDYEGAYKVSGEALHRLRVGFAKLGDVVYTHKGSVGRVATIDRDCVLTPQTTYYRVSPKIFVNSFLMYYLASQAFSEQVDVIKEQTTRDFVPISEQYLLFHRIPPLTEQHEIVRRVEALFKTTDALEARYHRAKAHVDKLTQSILTKAFRGELVSQDSNDEPVSILLERIRMEHALKHKVPKKPRRTASVKPKRSEVTMLNPEEIKHSHLSDILKDRGPLPPEALWNESQLDIDDFYAQLKQEENGGLLKETSNDASKGSRLLEAA